MKPGKGPMKPRHEYKLTGKAEGFKGTEKLAKGGMVMKPDATMKKGKHGCG